MEKAYFAAGCFWHVEAAFRRIPGVVDARVGYTGGHEDNPTYEKVCTGMTGHAEAVEVSFDPEKLHYGDLLDAFFSLHNPTTLNRQGPDIGEQYRSAIFFTSPEQQKAAQKKIEELTSQRRFSRPIVTEVTPFTIFYPAEDYHQRYFEKHGRICGV